MNLLNAISEYFAKGQKGQLIVKFSNDVHLCKILIDDGEAVHITHGRVAPEAILQSLPSKTVEWVNFIAGYPVRKKLDLPLHQKLLEILGNKSHNPAPAVQATTPAMPQRPAEPAPQAPDQAPVEAANAPVMSAAQIDEAIAGFIDIIGPLGTILSENICSALNHTPGAVMTQPIYESFISALGKEVPEAYRDNFLEKFKL